MKKAITCKDSVLVKELLHAKNFLQKAGINSYVLDAQLLLAKTLNTSRESIIGNQERKLTYNEQEIFNTLIKRRANREPMSHILGKREFWSRNFKVTSDTLDPRPDSETLIEAALELFPGKSEKLNIIDFGTGTGCLLLTLLSEYKNSTGLGVDISNRALDVAKENSCKLGLAKRASFIVSNWGKDVKGKYDLIISNPPYIKNSDITELEPEVSRHEPKSALDGGNSGLECYKGLAPFIASLISDNGFAILELGIGQDEDVRTILENVGLTFVAYKKDLTGINRCIVVRL